MNRAWDFISSETISKERDRWGTTTHFFCDADSQRSVKAELGADNFCVVSDSRLSKVELTDNLVIKTERLPLRKRISHIRIKPDPVHGHMGVAGEALNTLIAKRRSYKAHRLVALRINPINFSTQAVFSRLVGWRSMHEILSSGGDVVEMLGKATDLLRENLEKGIFHGDVNISNIFFSADLSNACMIDMQVAVARRCAVSEGLAMQLARLRDERLAPFITEQSYVNSALAQLKTHTARALFKKYFAPYLGRPMRYARLLEASQSNPDLMDLL